MALIAGIFLVIIGGIMIITPNIMWKIADSWKTKTKSEPTNFYLKFIQIGGCILVIGGIFGVFYG